MQTNVQIDQVKYGVTRHLSVGEKIFLGIFQQGIQRTTDEHYEMPLPVRNKDMHLPQNTALAFQWLKSKRKIFSNDQNYRIHYYDFMGNLCYAEKVP